MPRVYSLRLGLIGLFRLGSFRPQVGTVEELLELVEAPRLNTDTKLQKGVFLTTVAFSDTSMSFTPNENNVLEVLNNNVIEGMIATMQQVRSLALIRPPGDGLPGAGIRPLRLAPLGRS
eukprot:808073-Prorocentrum_minimum.AAC.1